VNVQEVPCWSRQAVRWIGFFAGRKYTAMRRTAGLSSSLHACSCVTITSVTCTSLNQKLLVSTSSSIKECDALASATLRPGCNIHEHECIPSFWSDTINCEWLVQVSRFLCFAFRVSHSIICTAVEKKNGAATRHFSTVFHSRGALISPPKWMKRSVIDDFRKDFKTLRMD